MEIVLGTILLIAAVFLIVAVLMQSGKSHRLSGSIAGGAENFFGKEKGQTADKWLSKATTVVAIVFVLVVIVVYVIQPDTAIKPDDEFNKLYPDKAVSETVADGGAAVTAAAGDEAVFDQGAEG